MKYVAGLVALLSIAYLACLEHPSFLFESRHVNRNLEIYSDEAFPPNIREISDTVLFRIERSPYFSEDRIYRVYISNRQWRWRLFSNIRSQVGGLNYCLFRNNAFIRPSVITENRIVPPGGWLKDSEERDLAYFISHEIAHGMMRDRTGLLTYHLSTPRWLEEGFADHVAKESFDFAVNLAQFKDGEERLTEASGLYVRFHLFVSYLVDIQGRSIDEILARPPEESDLVAELGTFDPEQTLLNRSSSFFQRAARRVRVGSGDYRAARARSRPAGSKRITPLSVSTM